MNLTELVTSIVTSPEFAAFIVTSIVAIAGWVAKSVVALVKRNLTTQQLAALVKIAAIAVSVAEQTGIGMTGAQKKAEAIRVAQTYLDAYGIKVSASQLEAAIEAAVYSQITVFTEPPMPEVFGEEPEVLEFPTTVTTDSTI